ncbi:MAG: TetR/AcrR family transcriptional regulator [Acidimicrobiales bacterium]
MARAGARTAVGGRTASGSVETRRRLIEGAIEALRAEGFFGASAREIARRAGCNQGLVFYHFGSVGNLLLAALDEVSAARLGRYTSAVEAANGIHALIDVAESVFKEDLEAGHIAVLAEMVAGASSTPGLGHEVAARIAPWRDFAAHALQNALGSTVLPEMVPTEEVAHAIVALYLGLEMLAHLDGDRSPALRLFDQARQLAALFAAFTGSPSRQDQQWKRPPL